MNTNFIQLIGYVGNNLAEKTTSLGDKKIMLRVATHQSRKDKNGKVNYASIWQDVSDETAIYAQRNFVKNSQILVQGYIIYRTCPDIHGHTRYVTEIKAMGAQS